MSISKRTVGITSFVVFAAASLCDGSPQLASKPPAIQPAADAPQPLSPDDSLATMKLPPGFRMELIAAEPLITEPSGVCWDEHGRLFVCELHGYNLDGHYDIEELNKTGKLDHEVRRIQATDEAIAKAETGTTGAVKRLIDTDGDGVMDKAEVWADDLPPCYGIVAARGGVIVACAPHIMFLADRDGDGHAEVRETLFTGFAAGILERRLNAPQWGLDGWIYFGDGRGGTITGAKLASPVELPRTDFRIRPDGSAIEPISGSTGGLGFAFTESDERLVSSIGWPATPIVPLPWHSLARNPYLASPPLNDANQGDRRCFPISQPHPWRTQRANDPGFSKYYTDRYGIAESAPNGYLTSCCAPLIYQDSVLPGLTGHLLACEPAQNLITRMDLSHDGARLMMSRVVGEEQSEFLASTDRWFHPIAQTHAPDGSIVIVDFYREIIEDYSAIPRYLQQQYSLVAGREHGRLWRLTHDPESASVALQPVPSPPTFISTSVVQSPSGERARVRGRDEGADSLNQPRWPVELTTRELVDELASPRYWRRQTAHRLLVERGDSSVAPMLSKLVKESREMSTVLHALYVLQELGVLGADDVAAALRSDDVGVKVHALRLAESLGGPIPARRDSPDVSLVLDAVLALGSHADHRVRLQLALTLGASDDPRVVPTLAALARTSTEGEPWLNTAITSSAIGEQRKPVDLIRAVIQAGHRPYEPQASLPGETSPLSAPVAALLESLARVIGTQRDDEQLGQLLALVAELETGSAPVQEQLLAALVASLKSGDVAALQSTAGGEALGRLMINESDRVATAALQLAGLLRLSESPAMAAAWKNAVATASNDAAPPAHRLAAISLLSAAPFAQSSRLANLLDSAQPVDIQLAAVRAVAGASDPEVVDLLLSNFAMLSPVVRTAIIDAVCSRQDRLPQLLDRIEQQTIFAAELPAIRRVQLLEHSNFELRSRAAKLFTPATSAERQALFARYQQALAGPRDVEAGRQVFEKTCAKCHQLGKDGFAVGPDLDSVRTRPDESLLLDILDPSGTINPKFPAYTVVTTSGTIATGILAGESATSITLRREKNETEAILRRDIEEMVASKKSLMPEGIEKELSPEQLASLLAYLRESLGPQVAVNRVLFDDEPEFVRSLVDGGGVATLVTDKHSGEFALQMTPLQRSSERVDGWNFHIVETPKPVAVGEPDQFRFLRFAWKSPAGAGVMLELADAGRWPPADQPLRRYCSGENQTDWATRMISSEVPREWSVVTVDLWQDFGEFTLTGIAPTAMGDAALFDRIELLKSVEP